MPKVCDSLGATIKLCTAVVVRRSKSVCGISGAGN